MSKKNTHKDVMGFDEFERAFRKEIQYHADMILSAYDNDTDAAWEAAVEDVAASKHITLI